jgi:predicted PurR-regulated permease PerM
MALPTPLRGNLPESPQDVLALGIRMLDTRALLWVVTLGAGAMWILALLRPELGRLVAASAYTVTVLWPFVWLERRSWPEKLPSTAAPR